MIFWVQVEDHSHRINNVAYSMCCDIFSFVRFLYYVQIEKMIDLFERMMGVELNHAARGDFVHTNVYILS